MIRSDISKIGDHSSPRSAETLQVDVIADFICPWSYIGTQRLADALTALQGPRQVSWLPFQLNPAMPAAGMPIDDYLRQRFGEPEALQPAMTELARQGQEEGLELRFDRIKRIPNTLNAHRLMHLSGTTGHNASETGRDLLRAFFEEGQDISDREILAGIALKNGISRSELYETLENDVSAKIVLSREAQVRGSGVTGVPDFLINRRLFVVGAQSTESLVNVFDRAMFGAESDQPVSETLQ